MTRVLVARCSFLALLAGAGGAMAESKQDEAKRRGEDDRPRPAGRREAARSANELLAKDQYDEALAIVDALAERRKLGPAELAQIHRFRGYIFVNKEMTEQAAAEFEKSLAQDALDRSAEQAMTYSLAQIYTQLGRYDDALKLIDTWFASEESPKPDAYYLKAMILVQQEKFQEARRARADRDREEPTAEGELAPAAGGDLRKPEGLPERRDDAWSSSSNLAPGKKRVLGAARRRAELPGTRREGARDAAARTPGGAARRGQGVPPARAAALPPAAPLPVREGDRGRHGRRQGRGRRRLLSACCRTATSPRARARRPWQPLAKAAELAPDGELYLLLGQIHLQREEFEPALDALEKALAKAKPERRGSVQLLIGVAQLGAEHFDEAERSFRAAQGDEKVRRAAESYLKFVQEQRLRREQQAVLRTAWNG